MTSLSGDIRAQGKWVLLIAGTAAGLQLFSIAGPMGEFLANTIHRVVIGYQAIFAEIWRRMSLIIGADLSTYKDSLTFSMIILSPYIIRWKRLSPSPFFEDRQKILAFLNLACVSFIATNISINSGTKFTNEKWLIWISVLPFSGYFLLISAQAYRREPEYRTGIKIVIFSSTLIITLIGVAEIASFIRELSNIYQPFLTISTNILASLSYFVGIIFRVDGSYPFLIASIFYFVFYAINYFMLHVAPAVDGFLSSIGA